SPNPRPHPIFPLPPPRHDHTPAPPHHAGTSAARQHRAPARSRHRGARRLRADVLNFDIGFSSTAKGEALYDTLHTLEAMHLDAIVVRHKVSGTPEELVRHAMSGVSVINAGDGNRAHP